MRRFTALFLFLTLHPSIAWACLWGRNGRSGLRPKPEHVPDPEPVLTEVLTHVASAPPEYVVSAHMLVAAGGLAYIALGHERRSWVPLAIGAASAVGGIGIAILAGGHAPWGDLTPLAELTMLGVPMAVMHLRWRKVAAVLMLVWGIGATAIMHDVVQGEDVVKHEWIVPEAKNHDKSAARIEIVHPAY